MRPLVVDTLLTYLELADVIEPTEPFYNEYQFTPLKSLNDICARFDAARSEFLRGIFSGAARAQKWYTIDLNATIARLRTTRGRIIKALSYLEEQGDLMLKVSGLRQGYKIKIRPADASALKSSLVQRFETRERNDVDRVGLVVELAEHSGCIVRHLLQKEPKIKFRILLFSLAQADQCIRFSSRLCVRFFFRHESSLKCKILTPRDPRFLICNVSVRTEPP